MAQLQPASEHPAGELESSLKYLSATFAKDVLT